MSARANHCNRASSSILLKRVKMLAAPACPLPPVRHQRQQQISPAQRQHLVYLVPWYEGANLECKLRLCISQCLPRHQCQEGVDLAECRLCRFAREVDKLGVLLP